MGYHRRTAADHDGLTVTEPPPPGTDAVGAALARVVEPGPGSSRKAATGALLKAVTASARTAGTLALVGGHWLTDTVVELAPRIPVRDLATLQAQHGLTGEELADRLVESAAKATAAVGAVGGAVATAQWFAAPTLLAMPAEVAAETLAVAAIEIKLVAELHEVYGLGSTGPLRKRAGAYLQAWADQRGVDPLKMSTLRAVVGSSTRAQLRKRLLRRARGNASSAMPLLVGAATAATLNRRATRKLAEKVRADLRRRAPLPGQLA